MAAWGLGLRVVKYKTGMDKWGVKGKRCFSLFLADIFGSRIMSLSLF
jgi:hypothetical protein